MAALLSAFLLGCICGLRSMTAPAVVAWGAHLGWLHLEGSLFAFFANKISLVIFSLFAVGAWIADKLPFISPRTQAGPLVVRKVFGAMCGAAICTSGASSQLWARFWEQRAAAFCSSLTCKSLGPPSACGHHSVFVSEVFAHECGRECKGRF
jgi:hypothetical protein